MDHSTSTLISLIGSRICHDLISPIGAIGNGMELLTMAGDLGSGPEVDLINESCASANARIRFFRIAFGAADERQQISAREIRGILEQFQATGRIRYRWMPDGDFNRADTRLACLALLCAETALPLGGEIFVDQSDGIWHLSAQGQRIAYKDALWAGLSDPNANPDIAPAEVQFALLPLFAAEMSRTIRVVADDTGVALRF